MFAQGSCESASNDDKRRCLVDISNDDKLSLKGKFGLQRGMVAVGAAPDALHQAADLIAARPVQN